MTRINKLVMEGFKSFAKRTELFFDEKFSVILGPNGSGKSNVLDALCFVLGRMSTKSLRAEKTANLIYNGGKFKNPANKAEVSIFFDNSKKEFPLDTKEVKISRIAKQNGQSVYRINDKRMTRQQVIELISAAKIDPEGYNIVLQGDIDRFVEMSSIERRQVIEEIAGIAIYEDRKQKALNELEKVEFKLKEAEIILTEKETYLKELKQDRDQALKYKDMKDKIDQNKATYLDIQIKSKNKDIEKIEKKIGSLNQEIDNIKKEVTAFRVQIEEKKNLVEQITKDIEERGEKEQVKVHKEVEELKVALATNKTKIESHKKEIIKIDDRVLGLKKDLEETDNRVKGIDSEIKSLEKKKSENEAQIKKIESSIEEFKKKHNLEQIVEIEKEIEKIETESETIASEIQKLIEEKQKLLREKDRIEIQIESIDKQVEKVGEIEKEHKAEIENLKKQRTEFKETILELNQLLTESSNIAAKLADARTRGKNVEEALARIRVKSVRIQEASLRDIAVNKILEQKGKIKGIYGTVSELGKAPSKYSLALEIAAGHRIKSIVVETDEVAAECINYLKKNKFGVATFLPLNKIKNIRIEDNVKKLLEVNGVHDFAFKVIDYDPQFKKVFSYVFADTLIVDNVDVARRIGVGNARMVTLEGDLVEKSGAMVGGYRMKEHRMGFAEKESSEELSKTEKQLEETNALIVSLEGEKKRIEDRIEELRNKKAVLEGDIIKAERSLHLEESDLEVSKKQKQLRNEELGKIDAQLKEKEKSITSTNKKIEEVKTRKQELRLQINKLRDPALVAELSAFEQKKQELRDEITSAEANISSFKTQIEMLRAETDKEAKIIKQTEKEKSEFSEDIKKLEEEINQKEALLKDKEELQKGFLAKFKKSFEERNKFNGEIQKCEAEIMMKEEKSRNTEQNINNLSLKKATASAELSGLEKEFEPYKNVVLLSIKEESALKYEIEKFERMIQEIGSVNLRALEIYDAAESQYKSLLEKKEKLRQEKEDVFKMMQEIESKKKDLFMKTFDILNENFKKSFSALTVKGEAFLKIENPEDPFAQDSGVLIRVKITQDKFFDIRSLSGGEKALTALAFIFAIQEFEPASFYILDEVDSALDKRNSEKLAQLIKKYSDKAQYIIISHNDNLITEGNVLYGISMDPQSAISSSISMKI